MTRLLSLGRGPVYRYVVAPERLRSVALLVPVALCANQAALAQPQLEQIYDRVVVSYGPDGYPVNETAVAFGGGGRLVALWNMTQEAGGQYVAYRLGYAVSNDGGLSWTDQDNQAYLSLPDPEPPPGSSRQFDPYVVYYEPLQSNLQWFIGGGIATPGHPFDTVFAARTNPLTGFFDRGSERLDPGRARRTATIRGPRSDRRRAAATRDTSM